MYILDTDHVSLLERGGSSGSRLENRLRTIPLAERTTTIISFEEQMRGWLGYLGRARSLAHQIEGYRRMKGQLETYCSMVILTFDEASAVEFQKVMGPSHSQTKSPPQRRQAGREAGSSWTRIRARKAARLPCCA